jgi:hypothetical protein
LCHRFGSCRYIAYRVGGIDLNQLLENVVRKFSGGVVDLCLRIRRDEQDAKKKRRKQNEPLATIQWGLLGRLLIFCLQKFALILHEWKAPPLRRSRPVA